MWQVKPAPWFRQPSSCPADRKIIYLWKVSDRMAMNKFTHTTADVINQAVSKTSAMISSTACIPCEDTESTLKSVSQGSNHTTQEERL